MKKTAIITAISILFAAVSAHAAAVTGAQNDGGAAFFEGKAKIAEWTYNSDGTIDAKGATINGAVKMFIGKGEKAISTTYNIKDNVIQDGIYAWTYKTGEPAGEEAYNNGKRHGKYIFLYRDGKTSKEGYYKNGRKDGENKLYFSNGVLAEEGTYKDGVKNGEFTLYFNTGEQKERFTYVNDVKHGTYQQFYKSGTIKMEGIYKNNLKEGRFFKYFESGEDAGIETYAAGKLISDTKVDEEESEVTEE